MRHHLFLPPAAMLLLALAAGLLLPGCASRRDLREVATIWQEHITQAEVDAVGADRGARLLKFEVDNPDFVWTDEFVGEVIEYVDELTTYGIFINPCCNPYRCCGAVGLRKNHYTGHCFSISTYYWLALKYLDYPGAARIQFRGFLTNRICHVVLVVEMPSGGWRVYDPAHLFGLEKIDALLDCRWMEFDTRHVWLDGDFGRGRSPLERFTEIWR